MNFSEAVIALKDGRKIRRKYQSGRFIKPVHKDDDLAHLIVSFADLIADDWEIVESKRENLEEVK